jgi:putative copper resistance protein D
MMHIWYVVSVWLHLVAASLWVGGMLFLVLVLVPALRRLPDRRLAVQLIRDTGRRFRTVGWVTLGVLLVTGTTNLLARGLGWDLLLSAAFWRSSFGAVLAFKLAVVLVILLLSAVHDFRVGPRASEALQANPTDPAAQRLRVLATWFGRLNLLLALVVVACGVMLVRGRPW